MARVKHAVSSLKRKKKVLKAVKGQRGARSKLLRTAKESMRKALVNSYGARKKKKSDFRALWITRITAACQAEGTSYSKLMAALKKANIALNRKMLADLAATDDKAFKTILKTTKL
ncbi:MAG: 50S ribosomal protein L20 [Candidatus Aadella gelida]|nr:50S ribosomal protein L20 [Candidatus Aadella gelida]